jgi:parallel beta-helix repeat protein
LGLKISSFCQGISVSGEVSLDQDAAVQPSYGCVTAGEKISDVIVRGNVLEHNDEGNAALDLCNAVHSTVQDNYLANKTDEIEVAHSEHVLIYGNQAFGGKDGLSIVASTEITVQSNTFVGSERGIYQKFGAANAEILGNSVLNVDTFGMILGDGNLVQGNTVVGSGWFGIEVRGGSSNTIRENVVKYNGTGGIVVGAGGRRAITECSFDENGLPFDCNVNWSPFRQSSGSNNVLRDNTVAFNDGPGILVGGRYHEWDAEAEDFVGDAEFFGEKNSLLGNLIYGNAGLGIDLSDEIQLFYHRVGAPLDAFFIESQAAAPDGPTPNNSGILANRGQNAPVLTSARVAKRGRIVQGIIDAPDPQTTTIELFANRVPKPGGDPTSYGEGAEYLGAVVPDAEGAFTALVGPVPVGTLITATATDADGNTSEFSAGVPVRSLGSQ